MSTKNQSFHKRKERVRIKLKKVSDRNRLSVFKSGQHIYAQIIDDVTARTLVSASTLDKEIRKFGKSNCHIENAILDKNCRIGSNVTIIGGPHLENCETDSYVISGGIVVVKKGATIPPGFVLK